MKHKINYSSQGSVLDVASSNLKSVTQIYGEEFVEEKSCELYFNNSVNIHNKAFANNA